MRSPLEIALLVLMLAALSAAVAVYVRLRRQIQRRDREYQVLTQIGQATSSRLNLEDRLSIIHRQLAKLFDVDTFYVAFLDEDTLRFEFHTEDGSLQPRSVVKGGNTVADYVVRTEKPLLVSRDMRGFLARTGLNAPGRLPIAYCGVPMRRDGKVCGVMAAMNYEREDVYNERDLELLETAAGQLSVAIENAQLFSQEQQRARYLEFLNAVSKRAISSQDAEVMLEEIVEEIGKHFEFDHISIGVVDYQAKEIVIKAEAGKSASFLSKRLSLGAGIIGRVARTGAMSLTRDANLAGHLLSLLPDAHAVLCIPLTYGETLLGVLNVESRRANAFPPQAVLAINTFADLLATALHNVLQFQNMLQQAITDGLTGLKTRRYFLEALQAEWKRASRNGRPFSLLMVDMDRFKDVNDTLGHLEGDLVLARVGRLLEQRCRQSNVVARYGGDEFVILMPETGLEQAEILAERLRIWMHTDPMLQERGISGSFGLATYPLHGATAEHVLRVADAGMYVSKHAGGNRVSTAEEVNEPEGEIVQRQLLSAYVQGFLQREQTGPDTAAELVATLKKLSAIHSDAASLKESIASLSHAVETREFHAAGHGEFTSRFVASLARCMGVGGTELEDLTYAARVHDVGKIVIPEAVLCKSGPLSSEELALVRLHPVIGAQLVAIIPESETIEMAVRHHHERYDGEGYPDGLKGNDIPLGARILGVADAYVDMTTERPYAAARSSEDACKAINERSGSQFDPEVVRRFLGIVGGDAMSRSAD